MADDTLELSADLFSPLTNELRVRIVVALGRHQAEHPDDRSLSFNELRDRVGGPDSGQFNYHLEQLQGPYVWHADGEYGLRSPASGSSGPFARGPTMSTRNAVPSTSTRRTR